MGFFRAGLVLIVGIFLFFSFLAATSFFILGSSLKYDNVHEGLYSVIKDISEGTNGVISEEVTGEFNLTGAAKDALATAKNYCKRQNTTYYNFSYERYAASIPCEKVVNATSPETFVNETYNDVIYDIYYKDYGCGFWNCFSKTGFPFFLVSKKAMDYWMEKFYLVLIVCLFLTGLIFLLVEQKANAPIIIGALLVISAVPLLKLNDFLYAIAGNLSVLINLFLSSARGVFFFSLIFGILLVATGIALRLWMPDSIKKKFSAEEVKEIVKEEISKEKQAQQVKKKKR
jgi:predicted membrane protein